MDQGTLFLHSSIASCKNKEYLTAVFKHWLKSCKEFLSEHFTENRLTLWCTVAKLWCHKLCAVFFGHPVSMCIFKVHNVINDTPRWVHQADRHSHQQHPCQSPDEPGQPSLNVSTINQSINQKITTYKSDHWCTTHLKTRIKPKDNVQKVKTTQR